MSWRVAIREGLTEQGMHDTDVRRQAQMSSALGTLPSTGAAAPSSASTSGFNPAE